MLRGLTFLLSLSVLTMVSCEKAVTSNVPQITLLSVGPDTVSAGDSLFLSFSIADGDADLGVDPASGGADIYVRDMRFDTTGFVGYFFPELDDKVLDPRKGVSAVCDMFLTATDIPPRIDTTAPQKADAITLELYVKDKAGHESNHVITRTIVLL